MGGGGYGQIIQMVMGALAGIGQAISSNVYDKASVSAAKDLEALLQMAADKTKEYAGEVDFPEVDIDPMDLLYAFMNPNANPALMAAVNASVEGLGGSTAGLLEEGGPQARLTNQLGAMNLTQRQFNKAIEALQNNGLNKKGKPSSKLNQAAIQAGYGGIEELFAAQEQYDSEIKQQQDAYAASRGDVLAGRNSALTGISQLQRDFPGATLTDINDLEKRIIDQRVYDIDRRATESRAGALQQANAMGLNPSGTLGEIEEERLGQVYDVEQSDALERAIMLLQGRQNLGSSAIQSLQSSLYAPVQAAAAVGGQYGTNVGAMGNLAMAQALAKNEILANQEFFNTQQQTAEDMVQLQLLLSSLGLQTQGGALGVQGDWIQATKTARAMDKFTSQYGGSGAGPNSQYQFSGMSFT